MRFLFVLITLCLVPSVWGQCTVNQFPFEDGEQLDYVIYYNWKKVWVPAGKVRFEVHDSMYNGKDCFHFNGRGKTFKEYDWLFKVRDQYQSFAAKKDLKPQRFIRDVHEGSTTIFYDYLYNQTKDEVKFKKSKIAKEYDHKLKHGPCAFDVITAVYFTRSIDFSGYNVNDTVPLNLVIDGELFETRVRYTGKGQVTTQDKKTYNVVKFKPLLIEGTIFTGGEEMEVSVTDDKNHIPLLVEAKILVGTIKVYIDRMKNVKYPLTSRVKK